MTTKPLRVDGADVSHHQRELDLPRAQREGLRFLYHKATEGDSFTDEEYDSRRVLAESEGLPFGAYHFARAEVTRTGNDAEAEARRFLKVAAPKPGDLVPALDLETAEGLVRAQLQKWAADFSEEVWRQLGVLPAVYSPWNLQLPNARYARWVPRYNNDNRPPTIPWDVWQFSDGVHGVPNQHPGLGHVDLNTLADGFRLGNLIIKKGGAEPDEADRTGVFRITTQNVRALPLMPQGKVEEDVFLTAGQSGVVFWQEIHPDRYEDAVAGLGPKWETYFPRAGGVPISWRVKHWERLENGSELLHEAETGVTRSRRVSWVLLRHRATGAEVLFHNWHYVAHAWSRPGHFRKRMWEDGNERHRAFLLPWIERGVAIAGGGDANSKNARQLLLGRRLGGRRIRYPVSDGSIDILAFINGQAWVWEIDDEDGELLPGRNSDHPGRRARVRLRRRLR